jgi:hypothetical protein
MGTSGPKDPRLTPECPCVAPFPETRCTWRCLLQDAPVALPVPLLSSERPLSTWEGQGRLQDSGPDCCVLVYASRSWASTLSEPRTGRMPSACPHARPRVPALHSIPVLDCLSRDRENKDRLRMEKGQCLHTPARVGAVASTQGRGQA